MANTTRLCGVEGCTRMYRSAGYCGLHYDRLRRTGSTDLVETPDRRCSVDGCGRAHNARGYCRAHYKRYLEHGDPLSGVPLKRMPMADERPDITSRILAQVVRTETGCLEWTGYTMPSGYGTISWNSRDWVVHRAMWTVVRGPIPDDDDWTIDHLCSNRRCVNVAHLEVVTRTVNSDRGGGLHIANLRRAQQTQDATHCKWGHAYAEVGWYVRRDTGGRMCKACQREKWARHKDRTAAERRRAYAERRAAGMSWQDARLSG